MIPSIVSAMLRPEAKIRAWMSELFWQVMFVPLMAEIWSPTWMHPSDLSAALLGIICVIMAPTVPNGDQMKPKPVFSSPCLLKSSTVPSIVSLAESPQLIRC